MAIQYLDRSAADIACSLPLAEVGGRMREFHDVFALALRGVHREPRRLTLELDTTTGLEPAIRDLVAREQACCAFFDTDVRGAGDMLTVELGVPVGAEFVLDGFEGSARTAAAAARPPTIARRAVIPAGGSVGIPPRPPDRPPSGPSGR